MKGLQRSSCCLVVAFLLAVAPVVWGQSVKGGKPAPEAPGPKKEEKASPPAAPAFDVGNFTYTSTDRRDPFEPVHLTKMKRETKAKGKKAGYELEELKLVGLMKTGAVKFVMMEDMQGKGMLFKKGDYLNSNLWILDITDEKVILAYKLKGDTKKIEMDIPRRQER